MRRWETGFEMVLKERANFDSGICTLNEAIPFQILFYSRG